MTDQNDESVKLKFYCEPNGDRVFQTCIEVAGSNLLKAAVALDDKVRDTITQYVGVGDIRALTLSESDETEFYEALMAFAMCRNGDAEYVREYFCDPDNDWVLVFKDETLIEMCAATQKRINQATGGE